MYRLVQNDLDWLKVSLLLKNPQFLANPYEPWLKLIAYEYVKLLEYQLDWIRIIDFLLTAKF